MHRHSSSSSLVSGLLLALVAVLTVTLVVTPSGLAQDKKVMQSARVDNTRMGAYRALAQLAFQAYRKGDNATAAELSRILELTWDQGEWHNTSEGSYCKANQSVCEPIDEAMDAFIGPIMHAPVKKPDAAAVESAYHDYLAKLEQAE